MERNPVWLRFDEPGYQELLRRLAGYTSRGDYAGKSKQQDDLDNQIMEILLFCGTSDEAAGRKILCESAISLRVLAIKLSRLGKEIPIFDLERQVLEFLYQTPEIFADGFPEAAKYDLSPKAIRPAEPPPGHESEKGAAPKVKRKSKLEDPFLERKVREAMNSIYLEGGTKVNWENFRRAPPELVQEYARHYFLKLLIGVYDSLDGSPRKISKSHQLAVYDGLRAYLPFRDNDAHFLVNAFNIEKENAPPDGKREHPDWPIAETLLSRVVGTERYTNIQMARVPFIVLIGEPNLRQMPEYPAHKKTIESNDPQNFKDSRTLDYINTVLKGEVIAAARKRYDVPLPD